MRIITGSTGTTHITSNDDGEFNQGIFGNGLIVLENGKQLSAAIVDNNTIRVSDGDLVFQGRHALIPPNTTEDITIETGTVGVNRNDLIVARYVLDSATGYESITLEVVKGTETTGTAVDPSVTTGDIRTGDLLAEVALYRVKIEGVNIVSLEPLFTATKDIIELIANLQKEINSDLGDHKTNKNNPHGVTKSQVGLGNVPNVATNDQTPTFSTASTLVNITSGEKLSVSFGKIAKAIADLISHIGNKSNPHAVTKSQVGLGNVDNTADSAKSVKYAATATSAGSLTTARNFRTNLGKTSTASFNGTADCDPGVIGTLGLGNGGTGATTAAGARTNLGLGSAATQSHTSNLPSSGSSALITSGAVYSAFAAVRDEFFTPKALSPTIASISNVSSKTINVWRSGKVITISLSCTLSAAISDWTTLVSEIPAPKYAFYTTAEGFGSSFARNLRVKVDTDGKIKIRYGSATEHNVVITYVCA